jgi:predicted alpha/beta hydrolase family esterase
MTKKIKVLLIHGGETFKNRKDYVKYLKTRSISLDKRVSWNGEYLDTALGRKFQIVRPRMPLQENAQYEDWKLYFERYLPLLAGRLILIGNSLGGIFLAKYLSENKLPKKALAVYLTCPPFDDTLPGEDLVGGFKLQKDLSLIEKNTKHLHLLFSGDDPVVPSSHAEKYRAKLPNAHVVVYKSKNGHFMVPTFPEIVKMIKKDATG